MTARMRAGRLIDAQLHLLDRQVLDRDGVPLMAVDDVELSELPVGEDLEGVEPPVVEHLLTGAVLGTRIFGGRPPPGHWYRLPWSEVIELDTAIRVRARSEELDLSWPERWVREHIIGRIPGGRHAPE